MDLTDPSSVDVLLYTRKGCHLCDEAKQLIRELQSQKSFEFREVDIDDDSDLQQRYNDEVPVVFVHGKKAFKYRVDPKQFLKRLSEPRP